MEEARYGGQTLNQIRAEYGLAPLAAARPDPAEIVLQWQCGECEWSAFTTEVRLRLSRQALERLVKHLQNRLQEESYVRTSP